VGVRRGRVGAHVSPTDESVHWMFLQKVEPTVRGKNGEERGRTRKPAAGAIPPPRIFSAVAESHRQRPIGGRQPTRTEVEWIKDNAPDVRRTIPRVG